MKEISSEIKLAIVGIIVIGAMQIAAMHYGINGTFRTICVGAILGIGGWAMPQLKLPKAKE